MKAKLIMLSLVAAMFITGCKDDKGTTNTDEGTNTNEGNNGQGGTNEGGNNQGGSDVPPPVIIKNNFEEALKKDYSNMTVNFALNSSEVGYEYGSEYYVGNHDFVAVLDGTTAETYGISYAWSFYSFYEGKSYSYWKGASYVTEGWVSNGSKGYPVGIDLAYFYMPYFLSNITADDVTNVMGAFVVKSESVEKVLDGLKFTWLTNDITYVDILLNTDGYISKIRGFDDPNNDDYGFQVELSSFGRTKVPTSVTMPPEIGPTTVKTYVEMIGHEEIPDIYMTDMSIVINDTVNHNDDYDIVMYPDDIVDLSFTYNPSNANKREVNWISTNEDAAVVQYGEVSGHQNLRAVNPGETEIYLKHMNEYREVIESRRLKVKVIAPKQVEESASDVYRFAFTGHSGDNGNYTIGAVNTVPGGNAPFTIKSWRMQTRTGANSAHFDDDDIILYSDAANSNNFNDGFYDEVVFDFENQQVNKVSFKYGLYWDNNASVVLGNFESATLSTSNDGNQWKDIDITEEFKTEFAKSTGSIGMTPKVLTKEFLPASMVKLVIKAKNVGGTGLGIGMENFVFSADETCRNFDDVDAVPVTSIAITAPRNRIKVGSVMKFNHEILPADASNKNVRWVSDDSEVLTIDNRTGLATAVKAGVAHVTAVSTSNASMVSNSYEVTVYDQEEIYDPNNLLVGKTFTAEDVPNTTNPANEFDVKFNIINKTTAFLTVTLEIPGVSVFESGMSCSYESFDAESKTYLFVSGDNVTITVQVADDGSYIYFTYKKGNDYVLGTASAGVILRKAA